jgi:hypothetical protein
MAPDPRGDVVAPTHPPQPAPPPPTLEGERAALARARTAVDRKLERLATVSGAAGAADALAAEYIDSVVAAAIERLQQDLVVFGRIDDAHAWRIGIYGIDAQGEQLVVDWRAPFAGKFYRATLDDPLTLARRVSYVGCIDDLFVEDFATGEVAGSSPLLTELSRSRGTTMRTAVATLQSEQDRLVRLDPTARLVLRGGPGTGKTVVGLHRAAWLVYNDDRVAAERILVVGPSDRFLRFVATVLPSLGEAKIAQTTFERLLGPSAPLPDEERWIDVLDQLEARLVTPGDVVVGHRRLREHDIADLVDRVSNLQLPWRDRRQVLVTRLCTRYKLDRAAVSKALTPVWPAVTTRQVLARLRNRHAMAELGVDAAFVDRWRRAPEHGPLVDEVRWRVEGVPARYAHAIVDEAQDLSPLQLRAVVRRADGVTLVGDDAQRSNPAGIGLRAAAAILATPLEQMTTAYRMSAEIADWLNEHARAHGIDAVELVGIRPTATPVRTATDPAAALAALADRWPNVALIGRDDVWAHKGVEYDAVVVDRRGMDPAQVYLAASRAAHELVLAG